MYIYAVSVLFNHCSMQPRVSLSTSKGFRQWSIKI